MNTTLLLRVSLPVILLLVVVSCAKNDDPAADNTLPADPELLAQMAYGQELMEAACYSCHNPDEEMKGRLAPPMAAVKSHYLDAETTYEQFSAELIRFVRRPSKGYAKMPGAINVFGLMPAQPHDEEDLRAIATYIYYGDLGKPDWLDEHQRQEMGRHRHRKGRRQALAQQGKKYALNTKAQLGKNLMRALQAGGPEYAIDFCNTRALPLTDSMALVQGATIRRVSDRARNPANRADSLQLVRLEAIREDLRLGIDNPHRLDVTDGRVTGYYPIVTNEMCLQCHGKRETDVAPNTLKALEALYPEDRATGYAANELRGIWVVEFPEGKR